MSERFCTVIEAQFMFGVQRCGKPAVTNGPCEVSACPVLHPICQEHADEAQIEVAPAVG